MRSCVREFTRKRKQGKSRQTFLATQYFSLANRQILHDSTYIFGSFFWFVENTPNRSKIIFCLSSEKQYLLTNTFNHETTISTLQTRCFDLLRSHIIIHTRCYQRSCYFPGPGGMSPGSPYDLRWRGRHHACSMRRKNALECDE